jgi:putative membrane-bound dehydrogenase-like protein
MRVFLLFALAVTAGAADFPAPHNTESTTTKPLPPAEAAAAVKTPPGFHVTMFAAEPDVQQPIAMATDSRGRLWVAECYTYAESKANFDTALRDRIVIFEDNDHDGHFDKRSVFWDQAQRLTSIELGFGGVWALCAPHLLFIPDKNGDDIPDGAPEVVLDGWDTGPVRHNIVNGLRWGPDGWLYGRHGILATSNVGVIASGGGRAVPLPQRTKMNVGVWRFHPTRRVFEVVANGTTNPWGMDWNEVGEAFISNTVIGHLWHIIPGAHYERMYGEDANPHVYQLMGQCADHYHFDTGAGWTKSRAAFDGTPASPSDALGGGHAHCGCLIYQGEQWPECWRGKVLTINFHGRRLNVDRLERRGSGYVAKHEPDAFFFGDPWFRGIDLIQAADGGVFVADWSDASECHDNDGVHRTSGRIYKITYGEGRGGGVLAARTSRGEDAAAPPRTGLAALSDEQLVRLQSSKNEWLVRTARRVLQERASSASPDALAELHGQLREQFQSAPDTLAKLRLAWALHVTGGLSGAGNVNGSSRALAALFDSPEENLRAWAVRLLTDSPHAENPPRDLAVLVRQEKSPLVKLAIASAATRDNARTWTLGAALTETISDTDDPVLQLMAWYAIEPWLNEPDLRKNVSHFTAAASSLVRRFGARLIATEVDHQSTALAELLGFGGARCANARRDFLEGVNDALKGRRKVAAPESWNAFAESFKADDAATLALVRNLSLLFGDGRALDEIRAIALDAKADLPARRQALQSLIDARTPDLRAVCEQLLDVRELAGVAARGLANFDDPKLGALLVEKYRGMYQHVRPEAIGALVSRPAWAATLLDAIANGQIGRADLDAFHARQIRAFNSATLTQRLAEVWGEVRETDDAKKALMAKLKTQLTPDVLARADLSAGRAIFNQACAVCHKLHGEGGALGPDITGSARDQLSYLIENIADPSAIVPVDFRLSIVTLKDGRVLSGFAGGKIERAFTLRTMTDTQTIERAEVEKVEDSSQSLMPEGLLSALSETQVRDLFGYLQSRSQVPLPAAGQ